MRTLKKIFASFRQPEDSPNEIRVRSRLEPPVRLDRMTAQQQQEFWRRKGILREQRNG